MRQLPPDPRPPRTGRRVRYLLLSATSWRRQAPVWIAGILIGFVAVVYSKGSHLSHDLFLRIYADSPYWMLLVTPMGLMLSVALLHRCFPGAIGSGIPQAIATLEPGTRRLREKLLTLKSALGKMLLTLIGIASGATFGYEGPIVQVGAAIKYSLNRRAALKHEGTARSLILAGGAAGVAAAFNAPLAGIVFAIEEMGRAFDQRASATILLSVILSGLTAMSLMGNYNYFGIVSASLDLTRGWIALPICGLAGGLVGALSARSIVALTRCLPGPLQGLRSRHPILFAAACGLLIATIGIATHGQTFGTGYYRARDILEQHGSDLQSYGILKLLTMFLSFISGAPGGMLTPSLAVGAGFGLNLSAVLPFLPATAVILLGMVAFFSGMTQAPMTAFVIVMEMTDSSGMIIPLMATSLIAANVSRMLSRRSLYEQQAMLLIRREYPHDKDSRSN